MKLVVGLVRGLLEIQQDEEHQTENSVDVHLINQGCSDTKEKREAGKPCVPETSLYVNENLNCVRDIKWACKPSEGVDIWQ